MQVRECMKRKVISISADATIAEAAALYVKSHVGLLPILDDSGRPIGMIQLSDLLNLELPDFIRLVSDVDFVHDFGAVETTRPTREALSQPVTAIMQPVVMVEEESGLLRAYALMLQRGLSDLPVVNAKGKLVGIVSRVDLGTAILAVWPS